MEFKLLVACAWIATAEAEEVQRKLIEELCAGPVDWDAFLALAARHQVDVIVANRLAKFSGDSLPPGAKKALNERGMATWQSALARAHELLALSELFAQSEVDLMPLKGNVLASQLFHDPGFRNVLDIDLLVRYEDLESTHQLLTKQGYHRVIPSSNVTPKQLRVLLEQCHHWVYRRQESPIPLEVHWRIFRWTQEETRLIWDRSRSQEWMGAVVRQPDHEMLLLILCDHGSQHRYNRLKWLSDILMLLNVVDDWNWPGVFQTARQLNLEHSLAQAALLIEWLYEWPLPAELRLFAESEPVAFGLAKESFECMLDEDTTRYSPKRERAGLKHLAYWVKRSARLAWYSTHLRKNDPIYWRIKPILIGVSDFDAFPLPDRFFWLYYPLRPIFWACRCIRGR